MANSRYYAPSVGLGVMEALQEEVARREMQRRQEAVEARQREQDDLARQREARIEAQTREQRDALTRQRDVQNYQWQYEHAPRGPLDPADVARMREIGMGGLIEETPARQGEFLGEDETGQPFFQDVPAMMQFTESPQAKLARQQREQRQAGLDAYLADPNVPENVKQFIRAQAATGDTSIPAELFKDNDDEMIDSYTIDPRTGEQKLVGKVRKGSHFTTVPQPPAAITLAGGMNSNALDLAAWQYLQTGQLPTRNANLINPIMNRAAQLQEQFSLPDPAASGAEYSADRSSLNRIQGQIDSITAFENLAKRNIDTLKGTLNELPDVGASFLNKPLRMVLRATGDPATARFATALRPVQAEVARILNGSSNLTGVTSVHAQQEVEELLKGDYTVQQLMAAIDILRRDMEARPQELTAQKEQIQGRIKSRGSQGAGSPNVPPTPAPPEPTPSPRPGGARVISRRPAGAR